MENSPIIVDVFVHYIVGGEELSASVARDHPARRMRLSRAPIANELLYNPHTHGMDQVHQVAHAEDGTVHAFVVPAFTQPHVSQAFGMTDVGVPSLTSFNGRTVGEMIAFLARYPADMEVTFSDRQTLVATAKRDMIVLRLDEKGE